MALDPRSAAEPTGDPSASPLKRGFGALIGAAAGALIVAGGLLSIAALEGVPVTALSTSLRLAVAGSAGALWISIAGLYLLARLAMRRRAKRHGVEAGSGFSRYRRNLVLSTDPAAALAQARAALLALPQGSDLDGGDETAGEVVGQTGASERSFGETIRIRVGRTTAGRARIEIESRPATWQLFDGAINAENVAQIARYLEARAAPGAGPEAAPGKAPGGPATELTTSDWFALAYLAVVVGYTGLLIGLNELWPASFAAWAGWLQAVPLDPRRLLGEACPPGVLAAGGSIIPYLNLIIVPTLFAYTAYNTLEFRAKRDRMETLNWMLCIGSLVFLPIMVLMDCFPSWSEGLSGGELALIKFIYGHSIGGALYALVLVIFTNGVSLLPAMVLAKIFGSKPKS